MRMSYDYADLLTIQIEKEDVKKCRKLIREMYNKYPKEPDNIGSIILDCCEYSFKENVDKLAFIKELRVYQQSLS